MMFLSLNLKKFLNDQKSHSEDSKLRAIDFRNKSLTTPTGIFLEYSNHFITNFSIICGIIKCNYVLLLWKEYHLIIGLYFTTLLLLTITYDMSYNKNKTK